MPLRLRRGTDQERLGITPAEGELIYAVDSKRIYVGDGVTLGGVDIVASAGGALQADLNLNTNDIVGFGNIDISGNITATNFIGPVTGTLTGNSTGTHYGSVVGDVTGNVYGNIIGGFEGDIFGSVFGNDSTRIIDATNNVLSTGALSLVNNAITVAPTLTSQNANPYGRIRIGGDGTNSLTPYAQFFREWSDTSVPIEENYVITAGLNTLKNNTYAIRGSFNSPVAVQAGDGILTTNAYGHDGSGYVLSSVLLHTVDNQASVLPGIVPGKVLVATFGADGIKWLAFDSSGRLGVNNDTPASELDVVGNAVVSGTVTAGGFKGSVFADDSAIIVDGLTGSVIGTSVNGGGVVLANGTISTADSSNLVVDQATRFTSDVIIDGSIDVMELTSSALGSPEISAALDLKLGAGNAVVITNAPFRLAKFTTAQRNVLVATNGDIIYNTTDDKFQGYQNGVWINLDDGSLA